MTDEPDVVLRLPERQASKIELDVPLDYKGKEGEGKVVFYEKADVELSTMIELRGKWAKTTKKSKKKDVEEENPPTDDETKEEKEEHPLEV